LKKEITRTRNSQSLTAIQEPTVQYGKRLLSTNGGAIQFGGGVEIWGCLILLQ